MKNLLGRFRLDRGWLAANATQLCAMLKPFLVFRGHNLYFPTSPMEQPELLPGERRVLAPVFWEGRAVGALRLDNVQPQEARRILPFLPAAITLCLQSLALAHAATLDEATGLLSGDALIELLARQIEFQPACEDDGCGRPACIGLIVLEWPDAATVARKAGYPARADVWRRLADELADMLPEGASAANSGWDEWRHEFTVLLPAFGRAACHALAREILARLLKVEAVDPFSSSSIPLLLQAGHIVFPQDLQGSDLRRPAREQALILRDRARLAAGAARRSTRNLPVLAFAWLLRRGGVILECLPHNRLRISLGSATYAMPGMRFYVYAQAGRQSGYKAEIIIRKVGERDSIAEIVHQANQANPPLAGDGLTLPRHLAAEAQESGPALTHVQFMEKFHNSSTTLPCFTLTITRFLSIPAGGNYRTVARQFAECLSASRATERGDCDCTIVYGYYGQDGLAVFWPQAKADDAVELLRDTHEKLAAAGVQAATGIFSYPCLNFSKSDSEACCLKALEYASLLPPPHIGELDHMALAISGDKRFSQGDELGAMEDYRLALLLKPDHALTLNSLAVCMAAMHKPANAVDLLLKALNSGPDAALQAKICYNLANIYQKENDLAKARLYYQKCVKADANHAYAWLRLGQIHAKRGKINVARAIYTHASRIASEQPDVFNTARRQLARLADAQNNTHSARQILHDSLLRNPSDTGSLLLLAQTYLADEPAIAETLARQCLRLGVDAYEILAQALEKQGRSEESLQVKQRV